MGTVNIKKRIESGEIIDYNKLVKVISYGEPIKITYICHLIATSSESTSIIAVNDLYRQKNYKNVLNNQACIIGLIDVAVWKSYKQLAHLLYDYGCKIKPSVIWNIICNKYINTDIIDFILPKIDKICCDNTDMSDVKYTENFTYICDKYNFLEKIIEAIGGINNIFDRFSYIIISEILDRKYFEFKCIYKTIYEKVDENEKIKMLVYKCLLLGYKCKCDDSHLNNFDNGLKLEHYNKTNKLTQIYFPEVLSNIISNYTFIS